MIGTTSMCRPVIHVVAHIYLLVINWYCSAVSVATCACVRMRGVVSSMDSACCRHAVRRFCTHTRLVGWVGRADVLGGVTLELGTLGTGGDMLIARVILRFISVWGRGACAVVCTLGTHCSLGLSLGVAACSNRSGCAFMCACVA